MKTSANKAGIVKRRRCSTSCGRTRRRCVRSDQAARKPMEEAIKDIDRILWRAFRWLDEAMGHLEVIRPRVHHVFHLGNMLTIERPRFDRGFVSFRRRALAGLEVLEHVEMFYRLEGDKPIVAAPQPRGVARRRGAPARLHAALPVPDRAGRAARGALRPVPGAAAHLGVGRASSPTTTHQVVQVTLRNVDRFESVSLDFTPDKLNEAALEDLVKLMMGERQRVPAACAARAHPRRAWTTQPAAK